MEGLGSVVGAPKSLRLRICTWRYRTEATGENGKKNARRKHDQGQPNKTVSVADPLAAVAAVFLRATLASPRPSGFIVWHAGLKR